MNKPEPISRRAWIKKVIFMASTSMLYPFTGWLTADAVVASKKVSKVLARYQNRPHDGKMCKMCRYFISPDGRSGRAGMGGMMKEGTCQLVNGQISPMGYCIFYTPTQK